MVRSLVEISLTRPGVFSKEDASIAQEERRLELMTPFVLQKVKGTSEYSVF